MYYNILYSVSIVKSLVSKSHHIHVPHRHIPTVMEILWLNTWFTFERGKNIKKILLRNQKMLLFLQNIYWYSWYSFVLYWYGILGMIFLGYESGWLFAPLGWYFFLNGCSVSGCCSRETFMLSNVAWSEVACRSCLQMLPNQKLPAKVTFT